MKTLLLFTTCLLFAVPPLAVGDDAAFRKAMAKAVRDAANRVLPSIVTVEIIAVASGQQKGEVEQDAPTSAVVLDNQGHVLASSIVVRRPSASILVVLPDGTRQTAEVIARDHHRDLVLLKTKPNQKLQPIQIPSQLPLRIGQTAVAVGRYGSDVSPLVSRGVLSAVERLDGIALQSDARVSPSFYGGPLIDLRGNFLGVLIPAVAEGGAEDATSWYDSGIAFAIPANVIQQKLDRLKAGQDIKKGLLGIVAKSKDLNEADTEIAAVRTRSPAEAAGLKAGDKVLEVSGTKVRRHQEIRQVLGSFDAGEKIGLKLARDGKEFEVELTLAETIPPLDPQRLGLVVRQRDTDEEDVSEVIVDAVLAGSPAAGNLKPGDVLKTLGAASIADIESLRRKMISAEANKPVAVTYRRDDKDAQVELTPRSVAGQIFLAEVDAWSTGENEWTKQEIALPDVANKAFYFGPDAEADLEQLGLLVLLTSPGSGSPEKVLEAWAATAKQAGVVVCVVAPENEKRWQPKELDAVAKFAQAVSKKAAISPSAVAVAAMGALAGEDSTAADSMALAVAISQSNTFFGAALAAATRPPAVRLRENEASSSLQILLPVKSSDDLPSWSAAIKNVGYPVIRGGEVDRLKLLQWVRLLQSI